MLLVYELSLNSLKSQDKEEALNVFNIIQRRNRNAQHRFGHHEKKRYNQSFLLYSCELEKLFQSRIQDYNMFLKNKRKFLLAVGPSI